MTATDRAREALEGITPGEWRWAVNRKAKNMELSGDGGNLTVMDFARWGMYGAAARFWHWSGKPRIGAPKRADQLSIPFPGREHHSHWDSDIDDPNARFIAAAPQLVRDLLAENDHLRVKADAVDQFRDAARLALEASHKFRAQVRAAEAALAAAMEGAVRVKPLEWSEYIVSNDKRQIAHAVTPFVTYRIAQKFFPEMFFSVEVVDGEFLSAGTLDAAKATAQSDYERRILAALEPNPAAQDRDALTLTDCMAVPEVRELVEVARIVDGAVKEGHETVSDLLMHLLSAAEPARDALRKLEGGAE